MKQIVLLERMEVCRREAQIYLQPVEEPHVGPGPGETCGEKSRFPGRTCDLTGDSKAVPEALTPGKVPHTAGAAREEPQPMRRTHIGEINGELPPVGGISCCTSTRTTLPEGEAVA